MAVLDTIVLVGLMLQNPAAGDAQGTPSTSAQPRDPSLDRIRSRLAEPPPFTMPPSTPPFPTRPSVWFWIGPSLVGIIGYLFAYSAATDSQWLIGVAEPSLGEASLAYALPLDYAGAGTAGSLIGYWMSRRWQEHREAAENEKKTS